MLKPVTAAPLANLPGIAHGFFTRHGGVSEGIFASLNCGQGSKDKPEHVRENRDRIRGHLGAASLVTLHQVHSATAIVVTEPWGAERPRADGMVTRTRGIALGALSADCTPVLLADAQAGVIGAAHAGWRGAFDGVVDATIEAMLGLGARRDRIHGAVGPCINQPAYEVGFDFEKAFLERDPGSGRFFTQPAPGARPRFDLPGYVAQRLSKAEIASVATTGLCTCAQAEDFFSYRRSQARKEPDYGRQISAIVLT